MCDVERLRDEREAAAGEALRWKERWAATVRTADEWAAERDEAWAAVGRVRALADNADQRVNASWVYTAEIRRALDGGEQ